MSAVQWVGFYVVFGSAATLLLGALLTLGKRRSFEQHVTSALTVADPRPSLRVVRETK